MIGSFPLAYSQNPWLQHVATDPSIRSVISTQLLVQTLLPICIVTGSIHTIRNDCCAQNAAAGNDCILFRSHYKCNCFSTSSPKSNQTHSRNATTTPFTGITQGIVFKIIMCELYVSVNEFSIHTSQYAAVLDTCVLNTLRFGMGWTHIEDAKLFRHAFCDC